MENRLENRQNKKMMVELWDKLASPSPESSRLDGKKRFYRQRNVIQGKNSR